MRQTAIFVFLTITILSAFHCISDKPEEGADLYVSDAAFPVDMDINVNNATYTVDFSVSNKGENDYASNIPVEVWISPTFYKSLDSISLGAVTIAGGIKAGGKSVQSVSFNPNAIQLATNPAYILIEIQVSDDLDIYNNLSSSAKLIVLGGAIYRLTLPADGNLFNFLISGGDTHHYRFMTKPGNAYELEWSDDGFPKPIVISAKSEDGLSAYLSDDNYTIGVPYYVSAPVPGNNQPDQYIHVDIESTSNSGAYTLRVSDLGPAMNLLPNFAATLTNYSKNDKKWIATIGVTYLVVEFTITNTTAQELGVEKCFAVGFWTGTMTSPPSYKSNAHFVKDVCVVWQSEGEVKDIPVSLTDVTTTENIGIYIDYYNEIPESNELDNAIFL